MSSLQILIEGQNATDFAEQLLSIEGMKGSLKRVDGEQEVTPGGQRKTIMLIATTIGTANTKTAEKIYNLYHSNIKQLEKVIILQARKHIDLNDSTTIQDINTILSSPSIPSLQEIAKLPIAERHQLLSPFIVKTAEDFINEPELTEFSVLDGENWE